MSKSDNCGKVLVGLFLGVNERLLEQTEIIEHALSKETLYRIEELINFFNSNPMVKDLYNKYKKERK